MNRLESFVHAALKQYPSLKDTVRTAYQTVMLPWIGPPHNCERALSNRPGYFFGFHDKTPWCHENRRLLAHRIWGAHDPDSSRAEVGYFTDVSLTEFVSLDETAAWSKQQGAQLQWCGLNGDLIYNTRRPDGSAGSIIRKLDGSVRSRFDYPIGAVDAEGRNGCVVEFGSFGIGMEGYGYGRWSEEWYRQRRDDSMAVGLTEIGLSTGQPTLHARLEDIATRIQWAPERNCHTFLSHVQYSPNGSQIAFFLRRSRPNLRVQTRMWVYDKPSASLTLMDSGNWLSHYCWLDEDSIVVYLENADGERRFDVLCSRSGTARPAEGLPPVDGHPQFTAAGGVLVLDSYANRRRRQSLRVFRRQGHAQFAQLESMRFYSPLRFRNEDRVDLHPRWDRTGTHICVDSSFCGQRSLTVLLGS